MALSLVLLLLSTITTIARHIQASTVADTALTNSSNQDFGVEKNGGNGGGRGKAGEMEKNEGGMGMGMG